MAKQDKGKDSLFLLEALVDKIIFAKPFLSEKDFKTCVVIESPNLEPLEICDEDCGSETYKKGGSVVTNFNCGKSCLFSMKDGDINSAMSKFNIKATVYKCLPCGCLPEKILIGEAIIDMTKEFIQARNQFLQDPTNVSYQALKDSFRIHGADGVENGDILMFLRLSCFGKLIVTRFQGAGSSKFDVGTKSPNSTSAANFPCNAGSGPTAICPQARDIYSNRPCIDSEDPCFCNGPKPSPYQPIACRNTDQYCLHIPKGVSSRRSTCQDLTDDQMKEIREMCCVDQRRESKSRRLHHVIEQILPESTKMAMSSSSSLTSMSSTTSSYVSTIDLAKRTEFLQKNVTAESCAINYTLLGNKETAVYMMFSKDYCPRKTSGTQATASLNKCLQVRQPCCQDSLTDCTDYMYTKTPYRNLPSTSNPPNTDLYYCTRSTCKSNAKNKKSSSEKKTTKNEERKAAKAASNTSSNTSTKANKKAEKKEKKKRDDSSSSSKTSNKSDKESLKKEKKKKPEKKKNEKKSKSSLETRKPNDVSKRDSKIKTSSSPDRGRGSSSTLKGDLYATVSHIVIGPREPCPHYGREPCQGPKCIQARNSPESEAVKVTNVTNSRRGVFELVIRKLNGAPLARNELMLEWTPPPSRPVTNNGYNGLPCYFVKPCRPSRTKMVVGHRPKCGKIPCRKSCCGKCHKCRCKVACQPSPCASLCRPLCMPVGSCKSTPCLQPCSVGYRKPRRYCSQPRIRPHRKRVSPCSNRGRAFPVVRCRSTPGPCLGRLCCPTLPARRCVSICRPRRCGSRCNPC